ncbi:MAG: hypothetical protein ACLSG5_17370 [Oscillospiraceae bacterium]
MAIFLSEELKNPLEFEMHVDTTELDKALEKVEKLVELLERAQELSANLPQSPNNQALCSNARRFYCRNTLTTLKAARNNSRQAINR